MPITLGLNIASLRAQLQLARSSEELGTVFERLSSGQRINSANDDAAGLAIADDLKVRSRIYTQGIRNLNDGISLFNIADSGIENLSSIIVRLEELSEQSANGVYTNKQRAALDIEAQALKKEFLRISKTTEFNDLKLFDGSNGQINLQGGIGSNAVLSLGVGGAIGTGEFTSEIFSSIGAGTNPNSVISGDFNGDGILDLATSDYATNTTSVLIGLGNGSFAPRVSYAVGTQPRRIISADFTNDGILDLATADRVSTTISLLVGRGDGTFAPRISTTALSPNSLASGDFNGDGILDLVTSDYPSNTANIYLGTGNGTFGAMISFGVGTSPQFISSADFDDDGILDLVTADFGSNTTSILLGVGNGTFKTRVSYTVGTNPFSVSHADFNGDGAIDLALSDRGTNTVSVLLGYGDGTFATRVSYSVGTNPYQVSSGDFNGDGILDLATADYGSDTTSVILGRGDGTFSTRKSFSAGTRPISITDVDLNGDGVLDIITASAINNGVSVLIGNTTDGVAPLLDFSLATMADARQALMMFKNKRQILSAQRGEIGANMARIEVAMSVLEVSRENFQAAESRIRDADIAAESSELIRISILQQAASAVLAQANQQPALALQLLN